LPLAVISVNQAISLSTTLAFQFSNSLLENFVAPAAATHQSPFIPATTGSQSGALPVSVHYNYYTIRGISDTELRSQMTQQGPLDSLEGRRYDANTAWTVQWSYRYKSIGHQCAIASVKTRVNVTFTLPKWQPVPAASRSLITEWNQYLAALQTHEDGHKNHGVAAGQEVMKMLSHFPPGASCQNVGAAANKAAQQIVRRYNQKDIEYDRLTQHGFTQGAVFPAISTVLRKQESQY
jgi:predicted secreted Zn-dependent protease